MLRSLTVEGFLAKAGEVPVIDVRSPGEFARGHIPGAHSLPLFSDTERTVIGTLYKQQGRNVAVLEGLRMVGPRMAAMVEEGLKLAPGGRIAVHCWRGGERSGSVAWLLEDGRIRRGFGPARGLQTISCTCTCVIRRCTSVACCWRIYRNREDRTTPSPERGG
ncbi:MAG: hypothetical protein IPO05_04765 [Flavobacteriales bacterium]|nr:hypothetical protein [Flavobacteriales bacterium]